MEPEVPFPENWQSPPELERALPREVTLTFTGRFKTVFGGMLILGAAVLFAVMQRDNAQTVAANLTLHDHGVETSATVTRLWRQGRSRQSMMAYSFTISGNSVQSESSVPSDLDDHFHVGGAVPVRYLSFDPSVSHPSGWDPYNPPAWMPFTLPAFLVVGSAALLIGVRNQSTLLARGLPAPLVITKCFRVKNGWVANFKLRTRDGAVFGGRCAMPRKVEPGTILCGLYDPQKPSRARAYPLDSYRLTGLD